MQLETVQSGRKFIAESNKTYVIVERINDSGVDTYGTKESIEVYRS